MGTARPRPLVLDAGALIAFDRGDERVRVLVAATKTAGARPLVPAGALAEAWRDGSRQARLAALVSRCDVVPLDGVMAKEAGRLCGRTRTSDVIDASVVVAARAAKAVVVTSDARDIVRLDPNVEVHALS